MQDNGSSHSAKFTKACLTLMGFRDYRMMNWPPTSPDLNPIENLLSILKRIICVDGRQLISKNELGRAIKTPAESISPSTIIQNLTDFTNDSIFDAIKHHEYRIDKRLFIIKYCELLCILLYFSLSEINIIIKFTFKSIKNGYHIKT